MKSQVLILMPVYNESEFLSESIYSIQSQSVLDWRLVIQDNCSEDETYELAQKFSQVDDRITVVKNRKKENVQDNWMLLAKFALENFDSDYVIWIGGDDIWSNASFLARKLQILHELNDYKSVSSRVSNLGPVSKSSATIRSKSKFKSIRLVTYMLDFRKINVLWSLVRRETFEQLLNHQTFRLGGFRGFDWYFGLGIFYFGKVYFDNESEYLKRISNHPTSSSNSTVKLGKRGPYLDFMGPYLETFWDQRKRILSLPILPRCIVITIQIALSHFRLLRMLTLRTFQFIKNRVFFWRS